MRDSLKIIFLVVVGMLSMKAVAVSKYDKVDFEKYMSRTRGNDVTYENLTHSLVVKDKEFLVNCYRKLAPLSIEIFYTISIYGKASDIVAFGKDVDISCFKKRMESITFPRPLKTFYGWWLVWDGAGG